MAKSKHNTTGNGTHRQRIFQVKQAMGTFRKAAIQAEKDEIQRMALLATQPVEGATLVGADAGFADSNITMVTLPTESSVKDDGLGHSHEDENLHDTMREFKGMVANDKHEQLMDTFVEGQSQGQ